jgi:hypothetical protein
MGHHGGRLVELSDELNISPGIHECGNDGRREASGDRPGWGCWGRSRGRLTGWTNAAVVESVYNVHVKTAFLAGFAALRSTCFLSSSGSLENVVLGLGALFGRHWGRWTTVGVLLSG